MFDIKKFSLYSLWGWCGGRHFSLAIWFSITAFVLAWHHLLTPQYAVVIGAVQGLMTFRSIHEDRKEAAMMNSKSDRQKDDTDQNTGTGGEKG